MTQTENSDLKVGTGFKIYFATNRRVTGSAGQPRFGDRNHRDGPDFYRVGQADVEKVSSDLDDGYQVTAVSIHGEGSTDPKNRGTDVLFDDMRKEIDTRRCDALIYIHGFANTFESSISRAAQLYEYYLVGPERSPRHPLVFAFCWPSDGRVTPPWEYFSDRSDARAAGPAMARTLLRFRDYMQHNAPCKQRIHLVAHSMGNWALRYAVQAIPELDGGRPLETFLENVFLMAADEDDDALEKDHKLGPLLRIAKKVHVYHSSDDLSLVISDKTKFNPNRLGFNGPRSFSGLDSRVVAIDCEQVDDTEHLHVNHQYYRRRPEVINDVKHVLLGRRPHRIPGREPVRSGQQYRIRPADERPEPVLDTPATPVSPEYVV